MRNPLRDRLHIRFDGGNIDGCQYVFERASAGSYTDENGVLQKLGAGVDTPRFESLPSLQFPDVSGSGKLYLHEASATNYLLQSEDFTAADWVATGLTVTANQATAPDNTVTADKLAGAAAGDKIEQTVSATVSRRYCFSVWLKADVATTATIELTPDGTAPTTGSQTCSVTTSWKRFKVKAVTDADSTVITARIITDANTIYAWGAQLEYEEMTSYIPTTTAAVSRTQDKLKVYLPDWFDFNNFEVETSVCPLLDFTQIQNSTVRGLWALGGNTATGRITGYLENGAGTQRYTLATNNGSTWKYFITNDTGITQYSEEKFLFRCLPKYRAKEREGGGYVEEIDDTHFLTDLDSTWRHWMEIGSVAGFSGSNTGCLLIRDFLIRPARYGERI